MKENEKMGEKGPDPATISLDVYGARDEEEGDVWNGTYGVLLVPDGWDFLAAGNAYLTRTVKKLGPVWVLKKSNPRKKYTSTLGLYAPKQNICRAMEMADNTEETRKKQRKLSAERRAKQDAEYRAAFREAVLTFLDFAPEHAALADNIANEVADHACAVGSGRVGRTNMLGLAAKVEFAVLAHVRHCHTDYDQELFAARLGMTWEEYEMELECPSTNTEGKFLEPVELDRDTYREIKAAANTDAQEFLEKHRRRE